MLLYGDGVAHALHDMSMLNTHAVLMYSTNNCNIVQIYEYHYFMFFVHTGTHVRVYVYQLFMKITTLIYVHDIHLFMSPND